MRQQRFLLLIFFADIFLVIMESAHRKRRLLLDQLIDRNYISTALILGRHKDYTYVSDLIFVNFNLNSQLTSIC